MKLKQINTEIKAIGDTGEFEAYLNNFDVVDHVLDNTQRGAFRKSIEKFKQRKYNMVMLYMHDHEKLIGHWTDLEEDEHGLKATGKIDIDTELGMEKWKQVKSGSLSGVSIGYKTISEQWDSEKKQNLLLDVDLLEASLVSVPCNDHSRITAIKTLINNDEVITERELEKLLKEAGLTNKEAKSICAKYNVEPEVIEKTIEVEKEITAEQAFDMYKEQLRKLFEQEAQEIQEQKDSETKYIQQLRQKYAS